MVTWLTGILNGDNTSSSSIKRALERHMTSEIMSTHLTFVFGKEAVHSIWHKYVCTDRHTAVPAQEESAQHLLCTLAVRDEGAQTFIHPQHRTWRCFQQNQRRFASEITTICSTLPISSKLPINQPLNNPPLMWSRTPTYAFSYA